MTWPGRPKKSNSGLGVGLAFDASPSQIHVEKEKEDAEADNRRLQNVSKNTAEARGMNRC